METKMNQLLSDFVIEYHKLQNFHWYAKGANFFNVHAKLEEIYNGVNSTIDELAEAMLMQEMKPVASLKDFMAMSKIEEAAAVDITADVIYDAVLADFEYLNALVMGIKVEADKSNNYLISGVMDGLISNFAKNIWMLKQTLK